MLGVMRPALIMLGLMTVLTGVVYPLVVTGVGHVLFSHQANGSLIERDGAVIGSKLIGQHFEDARYFWGRPSATNRFEYNAGESGGSNLGPTNPELLEKVKDRVEKIRAAHPDQRKSKAVPGDLVTTSASGLDPHISPAAAEYQVARVAKARRVSEQSVRVLVAKHTEGRWLGILGEPRVNVLRLNLDLDGR
jgi:K+-transporting ATPase ATPase C chain